MKTITYSLESGNKYMGSVDGDTTFYIGSRVSYGGNKGLMNTQGTARQKYSSDNWRNKYGFWADFIQPTSTCEGALFHTLNTYDKARFTFSFLQYAAHVPNGDFVTYFRQLLTLPLAKDYFNDLVLDNGYICKVSDNGLIKLEDNTTTQLLMNYLNPTSLQVEDVEIIQAAKFIDWIDNDVSHQELIVEHGINLFKQKMRSYGIKYHLEGQPDTVCLVIADIHHQGRGSASDVIHALNSSKPLDNLLEIGHIKYPERVKTLAKEITRLSNAGFLGIKKYNVTKADFD